jgi:hypothetical protein
LQNSRPYSDKNLKPLFSISVIPSPTDRSFQSKKPCSKRASFAASVVYIVDAIGDGGLVMCQNADALKGYEDSTAFSRGVVMFQPYVSGNQAVADRRQLAAHQALAICLVRLDPETSRVTCPFAPLHWALFHCPTSAHSCLSADPFTAYIGWLVVLRLSGLSHQSTC